MTTNFAFHAARLFHDNVRDVLKRIVETQMPQINQAAERIADTIARDGIVYALGSGHSLTIAAEMYFRAGGLAPCDVIHDRTFGRAERLPGYAAALLDGYPIGSKDLLVVASNSGRNALPVEMALEARRRGIYTIAITSMAHSRSVSSRLEQGVRLFEVCDLVIDNCGEPGDASVPVTPGSAVKVAPTSTIAGVFIANCVTGRAAQLLKARGIEPPIFLSANLDGADERNAQLMEFHRQRIRGL